MISRPKLYIQLIGAWLILILYKYLICKFQTQSYGFEVICDLAWKNGLIYCITFTISTIILRNSLIFGFSYLFKILLTFLLYVLIFGVIAFPYMYVSFLHPFASNSLFHVSGLLLLFDVVIEFVFHIKKNKKELK